MHSSFNDFIAANEQHCSNSRAANEKGKRFEIVSKEEFTKIKIDGGLITSHIVNKCDYGFIRHSNEDIYFVELKGKDIETALEQIISSINIFETEFIRTKKSQRFGFIVSSKFPRAGADRNNLVQKFKSRYGQSLDIQSRELKHRPK